MVHLITTDDTCSEGTMSPIASIVIHTDFIPIYVCRSYHWGITTIPKNGMLGVTELSYYFWYDIHTSFFTVLLQTDLKAGKDVRRPSGCSAWPHPLILQVWTHAFLALGLFIPADCIERLT